MVNPAVSSAFADSGLSSFTFQWYDIAVLLGIFLIVSEINYFRNIRKDVEGETTYTKPEENLGFNKRMAMLLGLIATLVSIMPYFGLRILGDTALPFILVVVVAILLVLAYWYGNMRLGRWFIEQETAKKEALKALEEFKSKKKR